MTQNATAEAEDGSNDTTMRDVAEIGLRLRDDGRLFKTALRAMATSSPEVGSEGWSEHVAGQVYGEAVQGTDPQDALDFVDAIVARYGIEDIGDVNDVLGRERFEQHQYEGSLAFVEDDR